MKRLFLALAPCVSAAFLSIHRTQGVGGHRPGDYPPEGSTTAVRSRVDTVEGCSQVEIVLESTGRATWTETYAPACGPAVPVLDGVVTYDQAARSIGLPVALHNAGEVRLSAPLSISASEDDASSGAQNVSDSVLKTGAPGPSRRTEVSFDSAAGVIRQADALTAEGRLPHIRPGGTTGPQVLNVVIPAATSRFTVTLHALAVHRLTIPALAPKDWPADVEADSRAHILTTSGWVDNAVYITFCPPPTAALPGCVFPSAEQRQAAVDAIDGELVGGSALGPVGMYYVRFPLASDKEGETILRALAVLRALPQVWHANPRDMKSVAGPA